MLLILFHLDEMDQGSGMEDDAIQEFDETLLKSSIKY
jgi:hypothetical protein